MRIAHCTSTAFLFVGLGLACLTGCADPTADKPQAVVNEPRHEAEAAEQPEPDEDFESETFLINPQNSKISFVGSKVTGSHDGGFQQFEGEIEAVASDITKSTIEVEIDTTSMWTDTERLTGHLKSPDFFEVDKYPTATFTSTSIEEAGDHYTISGDLELHGVTKNITFPAEIGMADGSISAKAEFAVKRFDFGIVYPGKPDDLIREDVLVKLDLHATPEDAEGGTAAVPE